MADQHRLGHIIIWENGGVAVSLISRRQQKSPVAVLQHRHEALKIVHLSSANLNAEGSIFPLHETGNSLILVGQFCLDELAVQAGDVGNRLTLRANSLASAGVGAVTKAQFVHLCHHVLGTLGSFYATLGKQSELADLRTDEKHSRTVLTSSHTSTTTDARCAVHGLVGSLLRDEDGVGILSLSGADGGVTTSLNDLVEG